MQRVLLAEIGLSLALGGKVGIAILAHANFIELVQKAGVIDVRVGEKGALAPARESGKERGKQRAHFVRVAGEAAVDKE